MLLLPFTGGLVWFSGDALTPVNQTFRNKRRPPDNGGTRHSSLPRIEAADIVMWNIVEQQDSPYSERYKCAQLIVRSESRGAVLAVKRHLKRLTKNQNDTVLIGGLKTIREKLFQSSLKLQTRLLRPSLIRRIGALRHRFPDERRNQRFMGTESGRLFISGYCYILEIWSQCFQGFLFVTRKMAVASAIFKERL